MAAQTNVVRPELTFRSCYFVNAVLLTLVLTGVDRVNSAEKMN